MKNSYTRVINSTNARSQLNHTAGRLQPKQFILSALLLVAWPVAMLGQVSGRPNDTLRKAADTMRFPQPFQFKETVTTGLPQSKLYNACSNWVKTIADSFHEVVIMRDTVNNKITVRNLPATADITCSLVISVSGNRYTCRLQQYLYHTIDGTPIPVEKAAASKAYSTTTNVERVIIMRKYPLVFGSLKKYIKRST